MPGSVMSKNGFVRIFYVHNSPAFSLYNLEEDAYYHLIVQNSDGTTKLSRPFNTKNTQSTDEHPMYSVWPIFYAFRYKTTLVRYKNKKMTVVDTCDFEDIDGLHEFEVHLIGEQNDIDVWRHYLLSLESYGECKFNIVENEPMPDIVYVDVSTIEISRRLYNDVRKAIYSFDTLEVMPPLHVVKTLFNVYEDTHLLRNNISIHKRYTDIQ